MLFRSISFLNSLVISVSVVNIGWDFFCCCCMVFAILPMVFSCAVVDLLLIVYHLYIFCTVDRSQCAALTVGEDIIIIVALLGSTLHLSRLC